MSTAKKIFKNNEETQQKELHQLLDSNQFFKMPKVGDTIKGRVISASRAEVRLDIEGVATGIVRGRELYDEAPEYADLKPNDEVEATVVELENENGEMELSFRFAGQQKAWEELKEIWKKNTITKATIIEANKGGLIITVGHLQGFLPVSQLTTEHYPRVPGGDKNKILEHLKTFMGQSLEVKIIDVDEKNTKLIVSEKMAWEEMQHTVLSSYKIGDIVEGAITAITDFGVFVKFDENLEGLVHISELAWQRVENPRDMVQMGMVTKAEIIKIDGSKIFLSMKRLKQDPWKQVQEKYKKGQIVPGTIIKINPFGLFVELDPEIHGLAHISELADHPNQTHVLDDYKPGDVMDFKIISLEPENHRLGLSLKTHKPTPPETANSNEETTEKNTPSLESDASSTQETSSAPTPVEPENIPSTDHTTTVDEALSSRA